MGNLVVLGIIGHVLFGIYLAVFRKPWDSLNNKPHTPVSLNQSKNTVGAFLLIIFIVFALALIGDM
jgi:magnesium-transporting ATPase (P-type)